MSLTPAQVELALNNQSEYGLSWSEISWGDGPDVLIIDDVEYPFELVDTETGGEGHDHTSTYIVFNVGEQTFKQTGYYMSHYGNDWDGPLTEVVAVEKTITVWEDK